MDRETLLESIIEISEDGQYRDGAYELIRNEFEEAGFYSNNEIEQILESITDISQNHINRNNAGRFVDFLLDTPDEVNNTLMGDKKEYLKLLLTI